MTDAVATEVVKEGAFVASLKRNNKKIRDDRAEAIVEVAEMKYKRTIEDLQMNIKDIQRERDNMIDLSPTTADSLILASDFDAENYVKKDIELGVKIRNLQIQLEIATASYKKLFVGA